MEQPPGIDIRTQDTMNCRNGVYSIKKAGFEVMNGAVVMWAVEG